MIQGSYSSEHSYDYVKPVTVAALELFDPELTLVFNSKHSAFQVLRWRTYPRRFWLDGFGWLTLLDDILVHVCDWKEGLVGRDDPEPLIRKLWESDLLRHPDLERERLVEMMRNRVQAQKKVRDNYRETQKDNRRQLLRAYTPVVQFPNFVN